jgi:threonine/homoserine/homoserine lactone efflux protein
MSSVGYWMPFIVATLLFACMPGPAILYMTAQTLAHGRRAGLMAALGIHAGCYVHIVAAAVGLAAMLHHLPALYAAIKLAGAAYLAWLGARMLRGKSRPDAGPTSLSAAPAFFRESFVVEMLNPKTALFFLTFLPQFVEPSAPLPSPCSSSSSAWSSIWLCRWPIWRRSDLRPSPPRACWARIAPAG